MPEWTTLKRMIWLLLLRGASTVIRTVTGTSPLVLENAVAAAIKSLKQYGKCTQPSGVWNTAITQYGLCEQNGTPTPDAPVDILCNNGVLRMVDDELPSGYIRLQYLESDGTSGGSGSNGYVDTGIIINTIDTDVEIDFQLTDTYAPSPRMAWGYMGTPSSLPRWGLGAYSSKWLGSPNATASVGALDTDRHVVVMRVYIDGSNDAFYSGTLDGETLYNANNLGNVSIFEGNDKWSVYLFARNNNNTAANFSPVKIFRFKVTKADVLTHDLIPCKDGNGVLGFYDLMTNTFLAANGTLIAGAADYSHSHLGADGTPEALIVRGENMANMAESNLDIGYYINNSGERIASEFNFYSLSLIAVKPSTTYTMHVSSLLNYFNVSEYADDKAFIKRTLFGTAAVKAGDTITFTTGETTAFIRFGSNPDGQTVTYAKISALTWMLAEGPSASTYKPYSGQTVSVAALFAVGNAADEQDIISGHINRNVGIAVLDGTTTGWALSDSGSTHRFRGKKPSDCHTPASRAPSVCTHFKYVSIGSAVGGMFIGASQYWYFIPTDQTIDTVDKWAAWVAEQYAAGTPVIVLYPLAEETTEQGTAYPQLVNTKYNAASVTAEVDNIQVTFTTGEQTTPNPHSPLPIVCNNGELKWNGTAVVVDGTPEVLTLSAAGQADQTATVQNLLGIGDYADEQEIISGGVARKIGVLVVDDAVANTMSVDTALAGRFRALVNGLPAKPTAPYSPANDGMMSTHFATTGPVQMAGGAYRMTSSGETTHIAMVLSSADYQTAAEVKQFFKVQYAAGTPVILLYPLAEEIEETVMPQPLTTAVGTNTLSWNYPGSTKTVEYAYQEPTNKVGTAKVGIAQAG